MTSMTEKGYLIYTLIQGVGHVKVVLNTVGQERVFGE